MKTIDFLVQELPKLGGWPDGAIGAGFLCGEGTLYFWDESNDCPTKWRVDTEAEVEDSASEISRDQYEAALAAKNDGWIEWGGGKHPPVSTNTFVDVKFKKGYVQSGYPAGEYSWEHNWQGSNIIAYRLHQPQQAEKPGVIEEDLNDCIGQAPVTTWGGEGLPPAGCECEAKYRESDSAEWFLFRCVGVDCGVAFGWAGKEAVSLGKGSYEFRPIRSEADKNRDEAKHTIAELCRQAASNGHAADLIYDAIAAGKVRGVKLEDL